MWINRLFVIVIIIASATFASFYGGPIPYSLFYFSLSLPLMALLYVFYVYYDFKIYQHVEAKTLVKGEPTTYSFELSNEAFITFQNIKLRFFEDRSKVLAAGHSKEYCLLPGDREGATSMLICNYLGEYEVGIDAVIITDFFNLFSITYPLPSHMKVVVLPRIITLQASNIISIDSDSKQGLYKLNNTNEERDAEVEKYRYGDSPKNIHWKASAKRQELMCRTFSPIAKKRVLLYLDLIPLNEEDFNTFHLQDQMIECLLALAYYCLQKNIPASVYYAEESICCEVLNSESAFNTLYKKCSSLFFTTQFPLSDLLTLSETTIYENNQYILVTHALSEALYKTLLPIQERGNSIVIIYLQASSLEGMNPLLSLFAELHIKLICLNPDSVLEEVL